MQEQDDLQGQLSEQMEIKAFVTLSQSEWNSVVRRAKEIFFGGMYVTKTDEAGLETPFTEEEMARMWEQDIRRDIPACLAMVVEPEIRSALERCAAQACEIGGEYSGVNIAMRDSLEDAGLDELAEAIDRSLVSMNCGVNLHMAASVADLQLLGANVDNLNRIARAIWGDDVTVWLSEYKPIPQVVRKKMKRQDAAAGA